MDTTDRVLLIILVTLLSIFFTMCIVAVVAVVKLINAAKQVVDRADDVLASVESVADTASDVFRETTNRKAMMGLAKTIYNLSKKGKK